MSRPQPRPTLPCGTILHHRYRIVSLLGAGVSARVYVAFDQVDECKVAVKYYESWETAEIQFRSPPHPPLPKTLPRCHARKDRRVPVVRGQGGRDDLAGAIVFRSQCLLVAETVLLASRSALPFTALQSVHARCGTAFRKTRTMNTLRFVGIHPDCCLFCPVGSKEPGSCSMNFNRPGHTDPSRCRIHSQLCLIELNRRFSS